MRMIKGAQKQMIVVRTNKSPYFDEAYFVLRREIRSQKHIQHDILAEANRILEENAPASRTVKKRKKQLLWGFLAGTLCGTGLAGLLFFLLF